MTREELRDLLTRIEALHAEESRGIIRLQELLDFWDDLTQEARDRIVAEKKTAIGNAQKTADKLPDFRGHADKE